MNLNDFCIGSERDLQAALETRDQGRGSSWIGLQGIGGKIKRRGQGRGFAAELRATVEAQFLYHLQGQKIALQNLYFRVEFGGIVIVKIEGGGIIEVNESGIRFID